MKWQIIVLLCCGWINSVFALGDTEISQKIEPDGTAIINQGAGNVTVGIPPSEYLRVAELLGMTKEKLGVTQKVLDSFFETLGEKQIPLEKLDSTLTEISKRYKELLEKVATFTSDDPEVKRLLMEAKIALDDGKSDEAEKLYNQASDRDVAAAKQLQETAEKRLVSAAQAKFANAELKMTKLAYQEAASYYQQAARLLSSTGREVRVARYLLQEGKALYEGGKYLLAELSLNNALNIFSQQGLKSHPIYLETLNMIFLNYLAQSKYKEASLLSEELKKIARKFSNFEIVSKLSTYSAIIGNLADLYCLQGQYEEALPLYQEALKIKEQVLGKLHPRYALSLNNLAGLYESQGKYEEALPLFQQAYHIFKNALGEKHPNTQVVAENLRWVQDHLDGKYQVVVTQIVPGSLSSLLGIQIGDILTHCNRQPILGKSQFTEKFAKESVRAVDELTVSRDGNSLTFQLKPGKIGVELEEKLKSEP